MNLGRILHVEADLGVEGRVEGGVVGETGEGTPMVMSRGREGQGSVGVHPLPVIHQFL